MLPKSHSSRLCPGSAHRFFALVCWILLPLLIPLPIARAVEAPPLGPLTYIQTNGPNSNIALGDWYTNTANGGVPGYHYLKINIPCGWPAATPVNVDLFSAEMNSNAPQSDEVAGAVNNTQFELYPPGAAIGPTPDLPAPGTGIAGTQITYPPSAAPEQWVRYATFTPTPATCGTYLLRAQTFDDDENGWRLRVGTDNDNDPTNAPPANYDNPDGIAGTNDEITIGTFQTTYQHDQLVPPNPPVNQCLTLYEYVAPGQPTVTFHNFDMDNNQRVTYYSPLDVFDPTGQAGGTPGAVSAPSAWNGGTLIDRGTGDTIANPVAGWWRIVSCVDNNNQYIQEGQLNIPAYFAQPPTPVMTIAKDDGRTIVSLNDLLTYVITFTNTSNTTSTPGAATDVVIQDTLPANTTYQSCAINAPFSGTCNQAAGVVTFSLNQAVSAGASGSVQVTVRVNSNATGTVNNAVRMDYQDGSGNIFPPVTATDTDTLTPVDLSIIKSDAGVTTAPGGGVIYTLSYANAGSTAASGVVITEQVPANTTFDAVGSTAGWSCVNGAPAGTICTLAVGSVAAGAGGAVAFAVNVDNPLPVGTTQIANSATIGDDGTHGADPTPGNNSSSDTTPLPPTAITLLSFTARRAEQGVVVRWETSAELNTWGFLLYRSADGMRSHAVRVTPAVIPGQGRGQGGAIYNWNDTGATAGVSYRYWLVEVEVAGQQTEYGPALAGAYPSGLTGRLFIPLIQG